MHKRELERFLKERIGLDRSVLCDFTITAIDSGKLEQAVKQKGQYASLIYDEKSPIKLKDGSRIRELIVKDQRIGKLTVSFKSNNLQEGQERIQSKLEMMVSGDLNNLQNLTAGEYLFRIEEVFELLNRVYGISADYSTITIKQLEINATFFLDEPYERYKYAILMMIRNVPQKRYKSGSGGAVKYMSWSEADRKTNTDQLETAVVKNSTTELKIYNKAKHLKDIGVLPEELSDASIMRIEYRIKERAIKSAFKDTYATSLTDEAIQKVFLKYFNRDVIQQYRRWKAENHKQLMELTQKHRHMNQQWTGSFLRECRQYEATHSLPILFDIEDMKSVIRELEPKTGRNANRKFNQFKKQSIYESDLVGNTARIEEIIRKITNMKTEYPEDMRQ